MRYQLRVHEKWYTLKSYQIISLNETFIFIPFERMMLNNTMRTPYSFISLFISWLHPFHLTIYMYTRMYTIIFFKLAEVWLSGLSMKKSSTFWTRVRLPRVATNGLYKYTSTLMPQFSVSIYRGNGRTKSVIKTWPCWKWVVIVMEDWSSSTNLQECRQF